MHGIIRIGPDTPQEILDLLIIKVDRAYHRDWYIIKAPSRIDPRKSFHTLWKPEVAEQNYPIHHDNQISTTKFEVISPYES